MCTSYTPPMYITHTHTPLIHTLTSTTHTHTHTTQTTHSHTHSQTSVRERFSSNYCNRHDSAVIYYILYVYMCVSLVQCTMYTIQCTVYSRPVRITFFFAILKTFTSVTIMYAMMNKCLQF